MSWAGRDCSPAHENRAKKTLNAPLKSLTMEGSGAPVPEFRILGEIEVQGAARAALGGRKQRALLAQLILHPNGLIPIEALIDAVWGETAPPTARSIVHGYVRRLRAAIGATHARLTARAGGYVLELDPDSVDAVRFERLAGEGRESLSRGDPDQALDALGRALELWRGRPLADLAYVDSLGAEVRRLTELELEATMDRLDAMMALGLGGGLVGQIEGLVARHPLVERLWGQLMLALYRSGRQADALAAFDRARLLLADQLGVDPGEQLESLQWAILRHDPSLRPRERRGRAQAERRPSTVRRVASAVFVGRREDLSRVVEGLRLAQGGAPAAYLVAGEAGVGKTRFAAEVADRARDSGFRVLAGGCVALAEGSLPYAPIVEALRGLPAEFTPAAFDALLGSGRHELARLMPGLGEVHDPGPESGPSGQGRFFELFLAFLLRLAAEQPLLCVVEDLHWADRSTLDLVALAVRAVRRAPIMLLATYRSDELHRHHPLLPVIAELARGGQVERLELGRFDREECAEQLAAILGAAPDPAYLERIYQRSSGNPFYAEELIAAGAQASVLSATLREVLLARVGMLSEPTQELLRVAAAGGIRIAEPVLAEVTGDVETGLRPLLREAVDRQILVPDPEADAGYVFRHALMQEALEGELLPGERAALHAAYATTLAATSDPADPAGAAALAYHWVTARDLPKALEASVTAGLAAERAYAFAEAEAQFERALELWERVPEADRHSALDRVGLLDHAARAADAAGDSARAVAHIETSLDIVDPVADRMRAGLLQGRLGQYLRETGAVEPSFAAHREAVRLIPAEPASSARAQVLEGLARRLMLAGQFQEAADVAREATRIAGETGTREVEAHALATLGTAEGHLGDVAAGEATLRRGRELALSIGEIVAAARAWNNLQDLLRVAASADAVTEGPAGADWADAHGLRRSVGALLRVASSGALWEQGRGDEAERHLELVWEATFGADIQPRNDVEIGWQLERAGLDVDRGRFDAAARRLRHARGSWRPGTQPGFETLLRSLEARLLVRRGDLEGARRSADELLAGLDEFGDPGNLALAAGALIEPLRIEAEIGRQAQAHDEPVQQAEAKRRGRAALEQARSVTRTIVAQHPGLSRRPLAALAICEAEWSRLDGISDPALWGDAATACAAGNQLWLRPYALYRQADALLAGVDRDRGSQTLHEAYEEAAAMGAASLQLDIGALARRRSVAIGPTAPNVGKRMVGPAP